MGFASMPFLLFAFMVMTVAILFNSGNQAPIINQQTPIAFCNPNMQTQCVSSNPTTYACQPANVIGSLGTCKILPTCNITPPSPAFCLGIADIVIAAGSGCLTQFLLGNSAACGVFLPANTFVVIAAKTVASDLSVSSAFFNFNISGAQAFLAIIFVAIGIAGLAGITVLGNSATNPESLNILFIGGIILGVWGVLSAVEGFIAGSPTSMFSYLNQMSPGMGSFMYVGLTLCVTIGIVGMVSRGGG